MSKKNKKEFKRPKSSFIEYLESLAKNEDRGSLASLRRGLQYDLGTCIDMYPYLIPWLANVKGKWEKNVYYLIASLFAYHPSVVQEGNMGDVFYQIKTKKGGNTSLEQRFMTLIRSDPEDLPLHLKQAISIAKSEGISVNWHELFFDLMRWPYDSSFPPFEKWAQSYWKKDMTQKEDADSIEQNNAIEEESEDSASSEEEE